MNDTHFTITIVIVLLLIAPPALHNCAAARWYPHQSDVRPIVRWSITQKPDPEFFNQFEIFTPFVVMAAFCHLVHTFYSSIGFARKV
jgi:hypothetical protein